MFERMITRIIRAIRLDWTVFAEIAQDRGAMTESAIIVALVTFLSALGSGIAARSIGTFFLTWLAGILVGWIGWAAITYLVGTLLFKGETDIPEMLRVLGYATAPSLLGVLQIIPCVGWLFPLLGWVLTLIAGVLAVREAMDSETSNAIITVVISWLIIIAIQAVFWFVL